MSPAREWDGRSYDRISAPMEQMGREVLDRLVLDGHEVVLDAGCGSGRVTEALLERVPEGTVIGVDGSAEMIEAARARLGDRCELLVQDLLELDLGARLVDAVLSTATFHWIADHPALFARLRAVLVPGGRLVAQCGGAGNVASVHAAAEDVALMQPFAEHFAGWVGPWRFATPEEATRDLEDAGFTGVEAWLEERPVTPDHPGEYLRTILLGSHLERLPDPELQEAFADAVHDRLGARFTIPYVRLNLDATAQA